MISSARSRIASGLVIPRPFAILRFTTNSNLAAQYPANVDVATAKHVWKVRSVGDETSRVHVRKTIAFERGTRPHLFAR
jgi:hypothetical protein